MQLTPRHRLTSKTAFILFIVFQTTFLSSYSQIDFEKGKNLFQKSEFDSAFAYFSKLIDSCGNACADSTLAIYKVYMGKTYTILEQYDKALAEFENAIQLMNSANSYNGKSFAMISLAEMYRKSYKLEKARLTLREVFDLHKKHSLLKSNEAYMYNRFAAVLNEQENFNEEVVLYSNKVLEITQETEDFDMMASSINELGYFEEKQKSYEKAMQYYLKAFEIYKKQDSKIYIAQMLTNLARISLYDGKEKLTEEYLKQGIQLTENTTWYDTRSSLLALYSSFLYDRGRWRESREILEQYIEAQVAKLKKQHSRALVEMESKYEFSKKTAIIEMEQQKSELAKAESVKKTQQRNYIAVGVVALLFLLMLLFQSYRKIKKTNAALYLALSDKELLLKEVNHRVKNNLQVISSLLELQAEYTSDENTKRKLLEGKTRINSIAHVHELMYAENNMTEVKMKDYIEKLSVEINQNLWKDIHSNVEVISDQIKLQITEAIPLGILLNELLTNSFKHAKPENEILRIRIELFKNKDQINLLYNDNGKNNPKANEMNKGIGDIVINGMIRQLHADAETKYKDGFSFQMTFYPQQNGKSFNS